MAVAKEDLLVNIEVNTGGSGAKVIAIREEVEKLNRAVKEASSVSEQANSGISSLSLGFSRLAGAAAAAAAAYYAIAKPIMTAVNEFRNAQDENQKLINILRLTGDNVLESSKRFEDFAENMQKTVGVAGGLTKTLITQAKATGLSNDQAEQAIIAAANLAEAYGEDVAQSFDRVINAYKGNEKALGPLSSLVADLTKEQIQAGEHVNRLNSALNGLAKEGMKTFSGQAKSFRNATEDLSESLGEIIVKSFGLDTATGDTAKKLEYLNSWIKRNSESFIEFGRNLKFIVDGVFNTFSAGIFKVIQGLSKLAAFAGMGDISKTFGDAADSSWEAAFNFEKLAVSTNEVAKNTASLGKTINKTAPGFEEASKAVDELIKKSRELQNSSELAGKSEIETARLKAVADLNELGLLEDKVNKNKAAMAASSEARAAVVAQFAALREASILKELDDIEKKNQQIAAQNETFGMNTVDRLNKELDLQLDLIEAQREKLRLEGKYTDEVAASLNEQSALLKERTAQQVSVAPSPVVENAGAAASALTGAASPLGAISGFADIVQGLIDFIPNLLGKIEKIFLSLTELPMKILQGVQGVFSAALKFVADFIPNIVKVIPKLFAAAIDFVAKLPGVFVKLVESLPDLLGGLIDKLPELAKSLVIGIVKAIGPMAKALITYMIKYLPQLTLEFVRLVALELPVAIVEGIFAALRGEKFEIPIDTAALSDTFKKLGQSLTGDASRIFAVSNLTEQQTGPAEKLKALADNVNKGFRDGASWLGKVWKHWIDVLVSSWRGIIAGLVNLWHGVIDFLNGVISAFKDMFAAVGSLLMGVVMGFRDMWLFVYNNVIMPLINGVTSAFTWIVNNVVTPLTDFATNLATSIGDVGTKLVTAVGDIGTKLAESFTAGLSGLTDMFKKLGEALVEPIKNATEGAKGGGGGLVGKVKKTFGFSEGGIIPGNAKAFGDSPRNDFIPAMLSPGEAVIPRSAMQDPEIAEVVRGILSKRGVPNFSEGMMPRLGSSGGGNTEINLGGVVVNTSQTVDADFVRSRLMPTIRNELRRASLDGQTVIYKTGVR